MRAWVRSTWVTKSGSSLPSRTTEASASADVISPEPCPRAPSARNGPASAGPVAPPAAPTPARRQGAGERVADRRRRSLDLCLRVSRLDLEDEVEPRGLREAREELVEDG